MVPYSSFLVYFVLLLSFYRSSSSSSSIPLSLVNETLYSDPLQKLTQLAYTSIARARHLKNPHHPPISTTALSPDGGGYTISIGFGTPPQIMRMIVDTGSSLSWFPCTKRYVCRNCSFVSSAFIPRDSSSAMIVGCKNPKCSWIHESFDPQSSCPDCTNCTQICPPYLVLYGSGTTGGIAMLETLTIPHKKIDNFVVGCSVFSVNQPAGIAGFGRGTAGIPNQFGLRKFSYCLVSHKFDNTPESSSFLSMDFGSNSGEKTQNFTYTPLLQNPVVPGKSALSQYYYIGLRRITVGGKRVDISHKQWSPDSAGNGGTIVDSGSTFTYMTRAVFDSVTAAFAAEVVKGYKRAGDVESATGLRPCFDVTGENVVKLPALKLNLKGGGEMELPLENYFFGLRDGRREIVCLAVVTDGTAAGPERVSGPAVILGNFFMQNSEVEYDLRNERFGFRHTPCSVAR